MASVITEFGGATKSSGTVSANYGANVSVGDLIVVVSSGTAASVPTFSDGANTFTAALAIDATADLHYAYSVATSSRTTSNSITVTSAGSKASFRAIVLRAGTGENLAVARLRQTASGSSTSPSVAAVVSASNIAVGVLGLDGPSGDTFTADTDTTNGSWSTSVVSGTTGSPANGNTTIRAQYKAVTAAGTQTYNPTLGTTRTWSSVLLAIPLNVITSLASASSLSTGTLNATLSGSLPISGVGLSATTGSLAALTKTDHPIAASGGSITTGTLATGITRLLSIQATGSVISGGGAQLALTTHASGQGQAQSAGSLSLASTTTATLSGVAQSSAAVELAMLLNAAGTASVHSTGQASTTQVLSIDIQGSSTTQAAMQVSLHMHIPMDGAATSYGLFTANTTSAQRAFAGWGIAI